MAMNKWTKIGAVVGGIWGLLAFPIYYFIWIMLFGPPPTFLGYFFFLPFVGPILNYLNLTDSMISGVFFNFVGWVLIGGTVGYLYDLIDNGE